jgi:hypothetical protein
MGDKAESSSLSSPVQNAGMLGSISSNKERYGHQKDFSRRFSSSLKLQIMWQSESLRNMSLGGMTSNFSPFGIGPMEKIPGMTHDLSGPVDSSIFELT